MFDSGFRLPDTRGFTLVELMIVVGIVAVLAAIAVPNFYEMQLKAKRAEEETVMGGLLDAETLYLSDNETYMDCRGGPSFPNKTLRAWGGGQCTALGFEPDGRVRGSYVVYGGGGQPTLASGCPFFPVPGGNSSGTSTWGYASFDLDGDGECATRRYRLLPKRIRDDGWFNGDW